MRSYHAMLVCLGMAVTLPVTAADEATGEYSDLQPSLESKIEAPPEHLDRGTLIEATATVVDIDHARRIYENVAQDATVKGQALQAGKALSCTFEQRLPVDVEPSSDRCFWAVEVEVRAEGAPDFLHRQPLTVA